ncbi:MAG: MFS transporter [Halieaceae bacterium]|nr:MFS transporter [Halieaceae bacterium]
MSSTLFSNRNFVLYLALRVFLSLSVTSLAVAVGWHIYEATGNAMDLAYIGLTQVVPIWALFLVSGWVVDNVARRRVLQATIVAQMSVYIGLAWILRDGVQDVGWIYILLLINACARAFVGPSIQSILPGLIDKSELPQAVSVASTVWTAATTVGPFVAGYLLHWFDVKVYWVIASLMLFAFVAVTLLKEPAMVKKAQREWRDVVQGIIFVWGNPLVFPSMAIDLFAVMMGSVMVLLPIYAMDILQVGPEGLGYMRAMPALGSVFAGLVISRFGHGPHSGRALFAALAVFTLSVVVFGLSEFYWLSLIALFVYGASDMVSVVLRTSIIHLATPDELRGRVNAVNSLFIASSNELGDLRGGAAAAWLGVVPAVLAGAVCTGAVGLVAWWRSKDLRRLQSADKI